MSDHAETAEPPRDQGNADSLRTARALGADAAAQGAQQPLRLRVLCLRRLRMRPADPFLDEHTAGQAYNDEAPMRYAGAVNM